MRNYKCVTHKTVVDRSLDFVARGLELEVLRNEDDAKKRSEFVDKVVENHKKAEERTFKQLCESYNIGFNKGYVIGACLGAGATWCGIFLGDLAAKYLTKK